MAVVDYANYRATPAEQARLADLLRILPAGRSSVLDVGARDGYISKKLTQHFDRVTALDLEKPRFEHPRITVAQGDVTNLDFRDNAFDVVCCLEVLEHIPPAKLKAACMEIARVARHEVVLGVPHRQDIRLGRTTCSKCGHFAPPWGHVNSFDESRLCALFQGLDPISTTLIGQCRERTNALATWLMDVAGNPWGTYNQEEPCSICGVALIAPGQRSLFERFCSAASLGLTRVQSRFAKPSALWIHMVFRKPRPVQ